MTTSPNLEKFSKEEIKTILNEVRNPFSVAVWGIKNYYNAGSAIRTAHNFLAKEVILIDCPAVYEKACMGTHKYENISKITTKDFIVSILDSKRPLVAFERRFNLKTEYLTRFVWPKNPILLFGCEESGIPDELLNISSHIVTIPQWGIHNDFNAGNAVAIGVYDWIIKNT